MLAVKKYISKALLICAKSPDLWMVSYRNLHETAGRARPEEICNYKLTLQLYKTFNNQIPLIDWVNINLNNILKSRTTTFSNNKTNQLKVGMNVLSNQLW